MENLRLRNTETIKLPVVSDGDKIAWWQQRRTLDGELKQFLQETEKDLLGPWRGMVLGELVSDEATAKLETAVS